MVNMMTISNALLKEIADRGLSLSDQKVMDAYTDTMTRVALGLI